ncbi:hypothetical protein KM924_23080 [Brevibacillus parabrevis]|nr:hypothetical protein [Brevibacillus parabrevis]MBU8715389.1 hypothetical protein [Brevibacillus parabrevis]
MDKRDKMILTWIAVIFLGFLVIYSLSGGDLVKLFWNQDAYNKAIHGEE